MYSLILDITSQWQPITIKSKLLLGDNTFKFLTSNYFHFHTINIGGKYKSYLHFTCSDLYIRLFVSYGAWKGQIKVLSAVVSLLMKVTFPYFNYWHDILSLFLVSEVLLCFLFQLHLLQGLHVFWSAIVPSV